MLITLSLLALLYAAVGGVILAAGGDSTVMVVYLGAMVLGQLRLAGRLASGALHATKERIARLRRMETALQPV